MTSRFACGWLPVQIEYTSSDQSDYSKIWSHDGWPYYMRARQEYNTHQRHCVNCTSEKMMEKVVWKHFQVIAKVFPACSTLLIWFSKQPGDWKVHVIHCMTFMGTKKNCQSSTFRLFFNYASDNEWQLSNSQQHPLLSIYQKHLILMVTSPI